MKKPVLPEIVSIEIGKLHFNKDNPRQIKTREFNSLVKSLEDAPEMFRARPLLISNRTGKFVVIGGNMRLRAAQKLGYKEVPAIILPGLSEEKEKEIAIKDNGAWGEWDWEALANSWDNLPLESWGVKGMPTVDEMNDEIADPINVQKAVQLEPQLEYIVISCKEADDFEKLRSLFGMGTVRRGGYHKGSAFDDIGAERVVSSGKVIALIKRKGK